MWENILEGLIMMLNIGTILYMAAGTAIGIVMGALPGLNATLGMALFVPVTFFMSPLHGIPFLLGLYKGAVYGGSISAILINTPGTNAAVATVNDGYPMARQGKAGKALKMALYSSAIGNTLGDVWALFSVGLIASVVLKIGRPEFFLILIFSCTMIGALSGKSIWRGLIAAGLGLFLSTIGVDPIIGTYRFAFGNMYLGSGLSSVPVLLGLFGMSEIISKMLSSSKKKKKEEVLDVRTLKGPNHRVSWAEFRSCWKVMGIGTAIGIVIGMIPALGQPIAAFLSYAVGKKVATERDKFGEGALEGVAAPEAANNAVNGGAIIPMLTLGIPGDMVTSILLGAFMAQGLRPGPFLFQNEGPLIYGILSISVLGNILMFGLGFIACRQFVKLIKIPENILYPCIVMFLLVGAFAMNNSLFDVGIMALFGIFGYGLRKVDIPLSPIVITFILGRHIEMSFLQSLLLYGSPAAMIRNPLAVVLLIMTILSVALLVVLEVRKSRKARRESLSDGV